jgi:hypothetical protein
MSKLDNAVTLYDYLNRGNEFKNEDIQYLYAEFCRQWKIHIHKVVLQTLKDTESQTTIDAREYFHGQLMFALIDEINNFCNPHDREIQIGIFIAKIAETLSTDLQVEIVYKVAL